MGSGMLWSRHRTGERARKPCGPVPPCGVLRRPLPPQSAPTIDANQALAPRDIVATYASPRSTLPGGAVMMVHGERHRPKHLLTCFPTSRPPPAAYQTAAAYAACMIASARGVGSRAAAGAPRPACRRRRCTCCPRPGNIDALGIMP
eukprot:243630-Chlamydomonas_euryale.AAC.3